MYSSYEINAKYPLLPALLGTGLAFWTYYVLQVAKRPMLASNSRMKHFLQSHCPVLTERYWPTPWCFESRLITIVRSIYKSCPHMPYQRELLRMPDGGQVALDWMENDTNNEKYKDNATRPTVIILPGLVDYTLIDRPSVFLGKPTQSAAGACVREFKKYSTYSVQSCGMTRGSSQESYSLHFVKQTVKYGYRSVIFNNRGNGGAELLTPRTYNATNTDDLTVVINHVAQKYPEAPRMAAGISLGGLILTNYLAKTGKECKLIAGMTVSVAYNVFESSKMLELPINNFLFNRLLANSLVQAVKRNFHMFKEHAFPINYDEVMQSQTIREFDDRFTAKQFGYNSYKEYYDDACIHEKLGLVRIPLLCLNAADDPFSPGHAIPVENARKSDYACIAVTSHGGHIGFLEGLHPRHESYMDRVFGQYVDAVFNHREELEKLHQSSE